MNNSYNFVKLPNDVIMQLSYIVALLFPILSVPSCQSLARQVSPCFPIQQFPFLHVRTRICSLLSHVCILRSIIFPNGARYLKWPVSANQILLRDCF